MKISLKRFTVLTSALMASLLVFAGTASAAGCDTKEGYSKNKSNIVDTAKSAGSFNTLITALKATGLDKALSGEGPFTVFAPTDEAFAKLPEGTLESLLKDTDKLAGILKYHVVSGKVKSGDVAKLSSAKTLQGQSISIDTSSGVRIDNANVASADVMASNGVIHVVDSVLMPKS